MGRQIIKQPDGKYAVWSSIVDDFVYLDCTKEELIESFLEDERERIVEQVEKSINDIETGNETQFTMDWKKCLGRVKVIHGVEKMKLRKTGNFE